MQSTKIELIDGDRNHMSGYLGQKMGVGEMDYRGTCKNFFGGGNVLYLDWGSAYMSVDICQN